MADTREIPAQRETPQSLRLELQLLSNLIASTEAKIAAGTADQVDWDVLPKARDLKAQKISRMMRFNETRG